MNRVGMLGSRPARSLVAVWVSAAWSGVSRLLARFGRWVRSRQSFFGQAAAMSVVSPQPTACRNGSFSIEVEPHRLNQDDRLALGTHLLVELYGCTPRSLERVEAVEHVLVRAARMSNANIISHFFHEFEPYGVSGVVVIEESHYTIHTWPENRYAAIDLFFCSETVQPDRALDVLREAFQPEEVHVMKVQRGIHHPPHITPG